MPITPQRVLAGLALVFAAIVIVRSLMPASSTDSAKLSQEVPMAIPGTLVLPPELSALLQPREVPTPNPDATWVEVLRISGTESTQSPPVQLSGNTARLRYTVEGEIAVLIVYVAPEGGQLVGFPDLIASGAGEGETFVSRPAGSYRLSIQSFGGSWTVEVAEELDA